MRRRLMLAPLLPVAMVVTLDAVVKEYLRTAFVAGSTTPLVGDLLRLIPARNPAGVFGLLPGSVELLVVLSLAAVGILVGALATGLVRRPLAVAGVTLVAGGAGGNLLDRLLHGTVLDYLDLGIGIYRLPLFNLADAAISLGVLLALLDALRLSTDQD